jgi:hypothetical protein
MTVAEQLFQCRYGERVLMVTVTNGNGVVEDDQRRVMEVTPS